MCGLRVLSLLLLLCGCVCALGTQLPRLPPDRWARVARVGRAACSRARELPRSVCGEAACCARYVSSGCTSAERLANAIDVCAVHWQPMLILGALSASSISDAIGSDKALAYLGSERRANDRRWKPALEAPYRRRD